MIRAEIATIINRPPEDVFAYAADFGNLPAYDPSVVSARRLSEGPIGVGTTWTHERTLGPQRVVAPIKMVEYEPPRRFVIEGGSAGFEARSTVTLEPVGDTSTHLVEVLEMKAKGMARLLEPMIGRQVPQQAAEVQERMKHVLEQRS